MLQSKMIIYNNNIVIYLYGDYIYGGEHFLIYVIIKSLYQLHFNEDTENKKNTRITTYISYEIKEYEVIQSMMRKISDCLQKYSSLCNLQGTQLKKIKNKRQTYVIEIKQKVRQFHVSQILVYNLK